MKNKLYIFFLNFKNLITSHISYILTLFAISIVIFGLCFLCFFDLTLKVACDSFFITGAIFVGVGVLQIVGNQGTFDLMSYSFANLLYSYKKGGDKKYEDVISYKNLKEEKRIRNRRNFVFYFFYGIIYLIGAIVTFLLLTN